MRTLNLSNGVYAFVDDSDYFKVSHYTWCKLEQDGKVYAKTTIAGVTVLLHRLILNISEGLVDHRDGNGLNNQRENLRIATHAENMQNRRIFKNNKSGYKGVFYRQSKGKWVAQIRRFHIGYYDDPIEAAKAYDQWAKELFGEFARLNFPEKK
jgi:hypothetical protein